MLLRQANAIPSTKSIHSPSAWTLRRLLENSSTTTIVILCVVGGILLIGTALYLFLLGRSNRWRWGHGPESAVEALPDNVMRKKGPPTTVKLHGGRSSIFDARRSSHIILASTVMHEEESHSIAVQQHAIPSRPTLPPTVNEDDDDDDIYLGQEKRYQLV
ncbi:hypothetical protein H257_18744 [Aphanomyces astaci]|uniref:Uncharacterized protein n=1 Tax=Aphanomyces astaci TaxID=112090 RepID=W4FBQ5_APHAT|nr:hypothetical protein H257_18744 [Aphanomyces astaci]ETV64349.1 hypothetical protein H257_18744 [Aphanomyces astaci]|eukprot:XP_009846167.1 hypothetical protein H257_18744 [Aphanomyces astaci]